jgi:hypothetical protein
VSGDSNLLGRDDDDLRKEVRADLVDVVRSVGGLFPQTEEEIDAFDEEHGPFEPLSDAQVAALRDAALARLAGHVPSQPEPQDWLWSAQAAACPQPAGIFRNAGASTDPAAADALEEHRKKLREEAERRRIERGEQD